jgi:hypothetical protein
MCAVGWLDLEHLGAEIRKKASGQLGARRCQVEHANAVEKR